jgi:hypothetical protein
MRSDLHRQLATARTSVEREGVADAAMAVVHYHSHELSDWGATWLGPRGPALTGDWQFRDYRWHATGHHSCPATFGQLPG